MKDAAARLPGSIGTQADVCTLIRDLQFIVEDISDLRVNQVVNGALDRIDRLHYELKPCVQFDKDRHLWVYLHGEREKENFVYDCSSSRKKGKQLREMCRGGIGFRQSCICQGEMKWWEVMVFHSQGNRLARKLLIWAFKYKSSLLSSTGTKFLFCVLNYISQIMLTCLCN